MSAAAAPIAIENPFPGLLSFQPDQSKFFYGRNKQIEEILRHLEGHRFLAVIGSSGCGKSSLVRAGLLPALYRGYLGSGPNWSVAVMKPGSRPIEALADALHDRDCFGSSAGFDSQTLLETTRGLVAVGQQQLLPGQSLLVVVDQFEEIFRFRSESEAADAEAVHFIDLLLQAASRSEPPIHVVLTMRTDYLTDCAQFDGLPEAMNRGQFLVPRMTREQRQEAIEGPLMFVGASFTKRLVQQVLNDFGDDPNNLPVLQHALRRTFERWQAEGARGPLDLSHYEQATTNGGALEQHCEELYSQLSPVNRKSAEKVFRCLTTIDRGRRVRRPRHIDLIREIVGNPAGVDEVIDHFRREGILIKGTDEVVDLTHESLISRWGRFKTWVDQEQLSAKWYKQLAGAASDRLTPWRGRELHEALEHRRNDDWNEAWAAQYGAGYREAIDFLERSTRLRKLRVLAGITLVALIIIGAALSVYRLNQEKTRAKGEAIRAEYHAKRAEKAEFEAESARAEALALERKTKALIADNAEEKNRLLKEAEKYQSSANVFRQKAKAAVDPIRPRESPKSAEAQPPVADPGEGMRARIATTGSTTQQFLLGEYSLQPIKGLEGRAAVLIGEVPRPGKQRWIYVVLSGDRDAFVPVLGQPMADKSVVKDLVKIAGGASNKQYPPLVSTKFLVSSSGNLGNGLELGHFRIRSTGIWYAVTLKEFREDSGGGEMILVELRSDVRPPE